MALNQSDKGQVGREIDTCQLLAHKLKVTAPSLQDPLHLVSVPGLVEMNPMPDLPFKIDRDVVGRNAEVGE
jgi:hypothetical protein